MKTKLIECKACGTKISKGAKSCPHCGEPSKQANAMKTGIALIGIGFGLMIFIPILIVIVAAIGAAVGTP